MKILFVLIIVLCYFYSSHNKKKCGARECAFYKKNHCTNPNIKKCSNYMECKEFSSTYY